MGGLCSKSVAPSHGNDVHLVYNGKPKAQTNLISSSVRENVHTNLPQPKQSNDPISFNRIGAAGYEPNQDEFYDGIPIFTPDLSLTSRSSRSKQAATKVSEVGSRISRASTVGLGKAVDVLDTLGSSMSNLNTASGFASGVATKGNELTILSFEVANTIVKGSNLVKSLSKRNIRHMKEDVLPSEGVQHLVSENMDELLRIVAADKREELTIFSGEVIRFGNSCKDAQWHNLDRYFEKIGRRHTPQKQLKEEVESVVEELMTLVQYTAELYHELHALDKFESNFQRQYHGDEKPIGSHKGGDFAIFRAELKGQRKQVRILKKKSLWSRSLEEVMEKLVDIVQYLHLEIQSSYGTADRDESPKENLRIHQRLGPAGLALHYANIVIQIDNLVARSSSMPPNTRDTLYQSLPPHIKSALRSKLQPFSVKKELTVMEIKTEMEKTLHWLVPVAANTAKAHHGFGWVGEWANTGSDMNRKTSGTTDVSRIETLHHADKEITEDYILELVMWLHQLVIQFKANTNEAPLTSSAKSPIESVLQKTNLHSKYEATGSPSSVLTLEDQSRIVGEKEKTATRNQ